MSETTYEVERWTSDDAEEMHVFQIKGDQRGAAYVLGFNPKLIPTETIYGFLVQQGFAMAGLHLMAKAGNAYAAGAIKPIDELVKWLPK